jgi:hypothetical protein
MAASPTQTSRIRTVGTTFRVTMPIGEPFKRTT